VAGDAGEVERLRGVIAAAFAARPYPGDDRIADRPPRYPDDEGHAVARFHRGTAWAAIALDGLRAGYPRDASACLGFMTPEGWRYYLPAYLVVALDGAAADAIGDAVVGQLTHPRARPDAWTRVARDLGQPPEALPRAQAAAFEARVSGLDAAERAAVRAVLGHLAARLDAEHAALGAAGRALPNAAREALASWWDQPERAAGRG
jgi:hypothetical protein